MQCADDELSKETIASVLFPIILNNSSFHLVDAVCEPVLIYGKKSNGGATATVLQGTNDSPGGGQVLSYTVAVQMPTYCNKIINFTEGCI